jgi:tRNA A37 threonylcarbamoyladenosine modification protein TsaB
LTIDTATSAAAIGVCSNGVCRNATPVREPASAQHVLGTIDRLLRDCALELKDLDRIVVGRGRRGDSVRIGHLFHSLQ